MVFNIQDSQMFSNDLLNKWLNDFTCPQFLVAAFIWKALSEQEKCMFDFTLYLYSNIYSCTCFVGSVKKYLLMVWVIPVISCFCWFSTNRFIQHFYLIILELSLSWLIVWAILIYEQWRIFMKINPIKADILLTSSRNFLYITSLTKLINFDKYYHTHILECKHFRHYHALIYSLINIYNC